MAQIQALGDNTALWLAPFKIAGAQAEEWRTRYGRAPQRRDFCNKMVFAADRGTGMYAGGNHGAPHVLNDAWEYHLGSNTWHLLFFPDDQYTTYSATPGGHQAHLMLEDGYLQTRRHGPIRLVHTWDGLTYDPATKRLLWANVVGSTDTQSSTTSPLALFAADQGLAYEGLRQQLAPATNMWMYEPGRARWFKQIAESTTAPKPLMVTQGAALEYIDHLKKTLWYANQSDESGMWLYDSALNRWERLRPNGGALMYGTTPDGPYKQGTFPGSEAQIRYSAKHRMLVAVHAGNTWEYSFDTNQWKKIIGGDPANYATDASTVFVYDSNNDVFLLMQPALGTLRAYSIVTKTWTTLAPQGQITPFPNTKTAGYFDPTHNALVVYQHAATFGEVSRVWLYRYKRTAQ